MLRSAIIFDLGGVLFTYNPLTVDAALRAQESENPFTLMDSNARLVKQLRQALGDDGQRLHELYILSNFSRHAYARLYSHYCAFFDLFDGVAVSGITGYAKPDRRAYDWLLNEYGLHTSECIFVDDTADYVNAAQLLGMRGIIYSNSAHLERELQVLTGQAFLTEPSA